MWAQCFENFSYFQGYFSGTSTTNQLNLTHWMTIGMQDVNQIQNQNLQAYSRQRISTFPIGKTIFNCFNCFFKSYLKIFQFFTSLSIAQHSAAQHWIALHSTSIIVQYSQCCSAFSALLRYFPALLSILTIAIIQTLPAAQE